MQIIVNYYDGSVGSSFNDARLVGFLRGLGMSDNGKYFTPFTITQDQLSTLLQFCMTHNYDFLYQNGEITVAERGSMYVE